MITSLRFHNWKSLVDATLLVDELTLLVGLNGAGKSNALDGFEFLRRLATGLDFEGALRGDTGVTGIRGGREWAARRGASDVTLGVTVQGERGTFDWELSLRLNGAVTLTEERLIEHGPTTDSPKRTLFHTKPADEWTSLPDGGSFVRRDRAQLPLVLNGLPPGSDLGAKLLSVQNTVGHSLILKPHPDALRNYSMVGSGIDSAAAGAAGALANFDPWQYGLFLDLISTYARELTGVPITEVRSLLVGLDGTDAILVARENWPGGATLEVDARAMSDGTLRFLAIAVALCAVRDGSLLVIDEVDDNVHPSRVKALLAMLREGGRRRGIDVLVTSQSEAMMNAADPELLPSVQVVSRRPSDGTSFIASAAALPGISQALASNSLGTLSEKGRLDDLARRAERA